MTARAHAELSEEAEAAERSVLGLTAGVGLMAGVSAAVVGDPLAVIGLPAIAVIALLARGSVPLAGYAGSLVWAVLLPRAPEEAMLVPIAMVVVCLAIGFGPERLVAWVRQDFGGRTDPDPAAGGWIEDDVRG